MAGEMEPLSGEVEQQRRALDLEEGSSLPVFLVDAQERLSRMSAFALSQHFADVVVAVALRRPGWTPRRVMAEFAEKTLSDEAWEGQVRGEVLRALRARGVELDTLREGGDGDGG